MKNEMTDLERNNIIEGNILLSFIKFILPLIATSYLMQSYIIVDGLILGNAINEEAIGSVNSVSSIVDMCTLIQIAFSGGCSICVSHLQGAKKYAEIEKLIRDFMKIILAISVLISAVVVIFTPQILRLINTPNNLMDGALTYLRIVFIGLPFSSLFGFESGILRGIGDSKNPLYGMMVSTFTNIGLDLLLVVVFKLNIFGAAMATVAAEIFSTVFLKVKLDKRRKFFKEVNKVNVESKVKESIALGSPQVVQSLANSVGKILIQNISNILGASVVIGVSVAFKIDSILVIPLMSMSTAMSVFVGQNIGADKLDRVVKAFRIGIILAISFSIVMTIVLWTFSYDFMEIFGLKVDSAICGNRYIEICLPFYWLLGLQFIFNGYLNGCKKTMITSISSIIGLICRVSCIYLLYLKMGMDILAYGEVLSWMIAVIIEFVVIIMIAKKQRYKV